MKRQHRLAVLLFAVLSIVLLESVQAQTQYTRYYGGSTTTMNSKKNLLPKGVLWYNTTDASYYVLGSDSTWRGAVRNNSVSGDLAGTLPSPTVVALTKFTQAVDSLRTVTFTADATKAVVPVDASAANVTVTLPSTTSISGRTITVFSRAVGGNKVIVKPGTSNYVSGSATPDTITAAWKSRTYVAVDSNWVKIADE